jgi:hypothetical protein
MVSFCNKIEHIENAILTTWIKDSPEHTAVHSSSVNWAFFQKVVQNSRRGERNRLKEFRLSDFVVQIHFQSKARLFKRPFNNIIHHHKNICVCICTKISIVPLENINMSNDGEEYA